MGRHLPPLNWLRAFEAAARHLNLTRAAEELHVTQAAVSQQVKALENRLGIPLFQRSAQGLLLTNAGQSYLPKLRAGFDLLESGTRELYDYDRHGSLTVRVTSSFSIQWLVPRMNRFYKRFPHIDVRLTALGREADFSRDDVDLEIRYGAGDWVDIESVLLIEEQVYPVCSPSLAQGPPPLREPRDLRGHTLLHVVGHPNYAEDWSMWLAASGLEDLPVERAHTFDQSVMALQAAINGMGVALGRSPIVSGELAAGRIVAPFELVLEGRGAYWIVYPRNAATRPKIKAFCDWLLEEAAAAANGTEICTDHLPGSGVKAARS